MKFLPKARVSDLVVQNLHNETLVYDLKSNQAFCLNEVSSRIFNYCDGETSLISLKERHSYSEEVIFLALDELHKHNLLEESLEYISPFEGMTRREAIRRVGFSTMAMLPVISALVAPSSAQAASRLRLLGEACTNSAQCSSTAPNCAPRVSPAGPARCCSGSVSFYDQGGVVNSCSGPSCSSATFACQSDANRFCCSNSASASCIGNSCSCTCN